MYYIFYIPLYLLSLLPMWVLYIFSDGVYLLLYHVTGYRKKTVLDNLRLAFPLKTEAERIVIAKQFYRNLIDSFIETLKSLSASRKFLGKRVLANWEVLEPVQKSGRNCQLHLGHTFNWEWGHQVLSGFTRYQVLVVYMPITNPVFEKLMYRLRIKYGNRFIAAGNMGKYMASIGQTQYLLGLVADQSPGNLANAYWMNFFGHPTPFVSGPEKGARAGNLPVFFTSITKPRRGHYLAHIELACENPSSLPEGELTRRYAAYMEQVITKNPEMWLWSHRRWKHAWNPQYSNNWIGQQGPPSVQGQS